MTDDKPEDLRIDRMNPVGTRFEYLPLVEGPDVYRAKYRTGIVVFQLVAGGLWVPYVSRVDRGDFEGLMSELTDAVDRCKVRFVGVTTPDDDPAFLEAWSKMTPDDARPLFEALHGFEFDDVECPLPRGKGTERTPTLVGEWDP